tara:strand:- start:366 stop:989 length:624 start_codon:yes stop_codon:yes gene_type:complete
MLRTVSALFLLIHNLSLNAQVGEIYLVKPKSDTLINKEVVSCKDDFYFVKRIDDVSVQLIEGGENTTYLLDEFFLFDSLSTEERFNYVFNTLEYKEDSLAYYQICFEIRFLFCANQVLAFENNKDKSDKLKRVFLDDVIKKEIYSANESIFYVLALVFISDSDLVIKFLNEVSHELKENLILNIDMAIHGVELDENRRKSLIDLLQQ